MRRTKRATLVAVVTVGLAVFHGRADASVQWGDASAIVWDETFAAGVPSISVMTGDLQGYPGNTPDTYIYVLARYASQSKWTLIAEDDDGGEGFASAIQGAGLYAEYDYFRVIVAAYSPHRDGTMDLWVDGTKVEDDMPFGGWRASVSAWHKATQSPFSIPADMFRVVGDPSLAGVEPISDSMIYLLGEIGTQVDEDDDSGSAYQALVNPTSDCTVGCTVLVAPYPAPTGGGYAMLVHRGGAYVDADGDGLSATTEADLQSSDASEDSDGDGIHDHWEVFGVPPTGGSLAGGDDSYEIHALGAWPGRRTTFVYVDRMAGGDLDPNQQSWLDATFRDDSVYTGETIDAILLVSDTQIPFRKYMAREPCQKMPKKNPADWISAKALKATYFDPRLYEVAHYTVVGGAQGDHITQFYDWNTQDYNHDPPDGCLRKPYHGEASVYNPITHTDPVITLYDPARGVLTHELGHNFGFWHAEARPTYPKSVMNYEYALSGYVGSDGVRRWSYSNGTEGPLCDASDPKECDYLATGTGCECDEWSGLLHPFTASATR